MLGRAAFRPFRAARPSAVHAGTTAAPPPVEPPTSGNKVIESSLLRGLGLVPLEIDGRVVTDALGTADHDTTNPSLFFAPHAGGRNQQDPGAADRFSVVSAYGKQVLRGVCREGEYGILRYITQWLGQGFDEMAIQALCYIPSDFELINASGGGIDGKSPFGVYVGEHHCHNPNPPTQNSPLTASEWRLGGKNQVTVASSQFGAALGVNMKFNTDGTFRFHDYLHVPGAKGRGGVWRERANRFSHLWAIDGYPYDDGITHRHSTGDLPRDTIFRIVQRIKMDTTLDPPNGLWELYIERGGVMVKEAWAYNLDLGGTVANRPALGLVLRSDNPQDGQDGLAPDAGGRQGSLYSATGGGWKARGGFGRFMEGGAYDADHIPRKTSWLDMFDCSVHVPQQAQPPPAVRVVNDRHPDQLFYPRTWATGVKHGSGVPYAFRLTFEEPAGGKSVMTLVPDARFGTTLEGNPAMVAQLHLGRPVLGNVDVWTNGSNTFGWRCEFLDMQDANGSYTPLYLTDETDVWVRWTGFFPSDGWTVPVQNFGHLCQWHTTRYTHFGNIVNITPDDNDVLQLIVRGGNQASPVTRKIAIGAIVKETPYHVVFRVKMSPVDGQAYTECWRWIEGVDDGLTFIRSHTYANTVTGPSGVERGKPQAGLYAANENNVIINPDARTVRFVIAMGKTKASVVPYVGGVQPAEQTPRGVDISQYTQIFADEFDGAGGSLPAAHWHFFNAWKGAASALESRVWRDAYYDHEHAKLDGQGNLVLTADLRPDGYITTSTISTYDDEDLANGLYWGPAAGPLYTEWEVDLNGVNVPGVWAAGWNYAPDTNFGDEIDDWEYLPDSENWTGARYHVAAHVPQRGVSSQQWIYPPDVGSLLKDGKKHVFARRIAIDRCTWFLDGQVVYEETDPAKIPQGNDLGLKLSIEADAYSYGHSPGGDVWGVAEDPSAHADQFPVVCKVGYVRHYRMKPVPVILDTDFGSDVDDVSAVAMLNRMMQIGECAILAMGHCHWHSRGVGGISVINDYYGHQAVPIARQAAGVNAIGTPTDTGYALHLTDNFAHTQESDTALGSTNLYRQVLAAADDDSVVFITIGPLHNIQALLDSVADSHSSLGGAALFNLKVKAVHTMGGQYPFRDPDDGSEWNFGAGGSGVTADVFSRITKPVIFNGYEVGLIDNGYGLGAVYDGEPATNPMAEAYRVFQGFPANISDHSAWDTIAAYTGVRGYKGVFTAVDTGSNAIQSSGINTWQTLPDKNQSYLVADMDPATFMATYVAPMVAAAVSAGGQSLTDAGEILTSGGESLTWSSGSILAGDSGAPVTDDDGYLVGL